MSALRRTIHSCDHHFGWDRTHAPVLTVEPGATVQLECIDAGGGQVGPGSTESDLATLDFGKLLPVTGPIFVDGVEPGDILSVTFDEFVPSGQGWTGLIPGFGLLAADFSNPALHLWSYDRTASRPAMFGTHARVPLKPFAGTVGVALAEPGLHSAVPPRRVGGNLDIRDLSAGTTLFLPVEVHGGLLSIGDTHAAQGDGEVCGTALESAMSVIVSIDVIKRTPLAMPRFRTNGPVSRHLDGAGYEVTTGVGSDLMHAAKTAVASMVDLLSGLHQIPAEHAYMLCSVCGDLRISEIVDAPNWVVSFYFPRCVFD